jgi:hypothetical protein
VALHFANNVAALFAALFPALSAPLEFLILTVFMLTVYFWWFLYQKTPEKLIPY